MQMHMLDTHGLCGNAGVPQHRGAAAILLGVPHGGRGCLEWGCGGRGPQAALGLGLNDSLSR